MDGGLTALGGFLYQTIGALGLKAGAYQEMTDHTTGSTDLETLLGFAKSGDIHYEDLDQDASIRSVLHGEQQGYILVQFKFSSQDPPETITLPDLEEILQRLRKSEARARHLGYQVTGFSLLSNRRLSEPARQRADEAGADRPPLHVAPSLPDDLWEGLLRRFAQTYGCVESEIESGIREGIGTVMQLAGSHGRPVITKELLVKIFTGHGTTRPLTPETVARHSIQELRTFFKRILPLHASNTQLLLRQQILDELSRRIELEGHAFIVLSGLGGNGKTLSLFQWMDGCLTSPLPQRQGAYYTLLPAKNVEADCFAHILCTWAGVPPGHPWSALHRPEYVLERLKIARQVHATMTTSHPVFILGLDAVDEALLQQDRLALRQLLMWFWEQEERWSQQRPQATLIVTCRNVNDLVTKWLDVSPDYLDAREAALPLELLEIKVDEFTADELCEVARMSMPDVAGRFEKAALVTNELRGTGSLRSQAPAILHDLSSAQAVDEEVFTALRHPILWRCFLNLDAQTQSLALNGESAALAQLTLRFMHQFCQRARARGQQTDIDLLEVVKAVAYTCEQHASPRYTRRQWIEAASRTGYMSDPLAEKLFVEALSFGLIRGDGGAWWRWHHPFIGEYLALKPPSLEDE